MKKRILVLAGILILAISFSQTLSLNLDKVVLNDIGLQYLNAPLTSITPTILKNLPNLQNTLYAKINLNNQIFYVALGFENGELILYADKNGDKSFEPNEKVYLNQNGEKFSSLPVKFDVNYSQKTYPYFLKFYVVKNSLGEYNLYYASNFCRTGTLKIGNNQYDVSIFNFYSNGRFDTLQNDVVGVKILSNAMNGRFYSNLNEIQIGGNLYKILSVSPCGDLAKLQIISKTEMPFSLNIGDKAPNLKFKTLDGISKSLYDFSKTYTLIFGWNADFANLSEKNAFLTNITSLLKKYPKLNLIGIFIPLNSTASIMTKTQQQYKNMSISFYMKQNNFNFTQVDYSDSVKLAKVLNIVSPNELFLLSKDSILIFKTGPVWSAESGLSRLGITFDRLQSLISTLVEN